MVLIVLMYYFVVYCFAALFGMVKNKE